MNNVEVKNKFFKHLPAAITAFSCMVFLLLVCSFWPFTVDDAFITFRYSRNLASGYGPTFNQGSSPVEGYTTFLWMLIMAVPHLVRVDAVTFAKVGGIIATGGSMLVAFKFAQRLTPFLDYWQRAVAAAFTVLMITALPETAIHAVSGMETALFTALLTCLLYLETGLMDEYSKPSAVMLAVSCLLLGLTRPEGNLAAVVGVSSLLMLMPKKHKVDLAKIILLFYVLPGALYFLWRLGYYRHLFPLPFYVKVSEPGYIPGMKHLVSFARYFGFHVGVLVIFGLSKFNSRLLPAMLSVCSLLVFFVFPEHIMGYNWRYLYPTVPFILVIAGVGAGVLLRLAEKYKRIYITGAVFLIFMAVPAGLLSNVDIQLKSCINYASGLARAHIFLGKYLGSVTPAGSSPSIALVDAGAIPYYSDWRVIDTYGLNDAEIALSGKHDPEYVLSQKPDLVILISKSRDSFVHKKPDWEDELYKRCLQEGMVKVKTLVFNPRDYYVWIMASPENPVADKLRNMN